MNYTASTIGYYFNMYLLPLLLVAFFLWRALRFRSVRHKVPQLIEQGAIILDVRSAPEFTMGAHLRSKNVPINELNHWIEQNRGGDAMGHPIIVCCASGSRSAMAAMQLKRQGFKDVYNVGPWTNLPPC